MKKVIKFFFYLLVISLPLAIVAVIGAVVLIDPNDYKDNITQVVSNKTGQDIQIDGNINFKLFPWLGLNVENAIVKNSQGFKNENLLVLEQASLRVRTLPLLKGKFQLDTLYVKNAILNLEKTSNDKINWDIKFDGTDKPAKSDKTINEVKDSTAKIKSVKQFDFIISNIEIINSTINYLEPTNSFSIKNINLKSSNIKLDSNFPIEGSFDYATAPGQKNSLQNSTKFKGTISFNSGSFSIKGLDVGANLKGESIPNKKIDMKLTSNLLADFSSSKVELNNLNLIVDKIKGTGDAVIKFANAFNANFNLNFDYIDFDQYQFTSYNNSNFKIAKNSNTVNPNPYIVKTAFSPNAGFVATGKINIAKLKANDMIFQNVATTAKYANSVLNLSPLSTNIYSGTFNGVVNLNLKPKTPIIKLNGKANSLNMAQLIKDLAKKNFLTGTGNFNANIQKQGEALNGTSQVKIVNGHLEGIDLDYYLNSASQMLKKLPPNKKNRKRTDYNFITGSFIANNSVITNEDMLIDANDFLGKGRGKIDLNNEYIKFYINITRKKQGEVSTNTLPLAVKIEGNLNNPKIEPDYSTYIESLAKEELEKQVSKKIDEKLGKILGGSEEGAKQEAPKTIEKKIEQEVEKGIKKIFGF